MISIVIVSILLFTATEASSRAKRNQDTFLRVQNETESFPCVGSTATMYATQGIPRIKLNDEQKLQLLHKLGGDFVSSIMSYKGQNPKVEAIRNILAPGAKCVNNKKEKTCFSRQEILARLRGETGTLLHESDTLLFNYVKPPDSMYDVAAGVVPDYCVSRTQPYPISSTDGSGATVLYRRMCKVCAVTRYRPSNQWPPVVIESVCDKDELGCLYEGVMPHGKCQQAYISFDFLQAHPTLCEIQLIDGQTVVTEKWYLEQEMIRTGCECAIIDDNNSENPRFT